MLLRVFAVFVVLRHEVFVRLRLYPLLAHDEDRDIGGEARQASGEPRDILWDVDDVTTVRILPSLEAVDAHDGGDLAMSICSTCVIPSSCGGTYPGFMSLSAEKTLGFFLSPLQRLHLCVCERARYRKSKVRRGAVAQYVRFSIATL